MSSLKLTNADVAELVDLARLQAFYIKCASAKANEILESSKESESYIKRVKAENESLAAQQIQLMNMSFSQRLKFLFTRKLPIMKED